MMASCLDLLAVNAAAIRAKQALGQLVGIYHFDWLKQQQQDL
jgi:hypothetical protein